MDIIFEDKDKIILNKEAGKLVQSGRNFDLDLVSEVMNYRKQKGEAAYAAVINRLDRPVSGVVLMAKNKEAAARYSKIMQQQGFNKHYYAIIHGRPDSNAGTLTDYVTKTKDGTAAVCSKGSPDAKLAELKFEVAGEIVIKNDSDDSNTDTQAENILSLVKIVLVTGRFHQIRVQFAARGHAIVGDTKYASIYRECSSTFLQNQDSLKSESTFLQNQNSLKCESASLQNQDSLKRERAAAGKISLAPHEIALCAHSINVDGNEYTVTPPWWIK